MRILIAVWALVLVAASGFWGIRYSQLRTESTALAQDLADAVRYEATFEAIKQRDLPELTQVARAEWDRDNECPAPGQEWSPTTTIGIIHKRLAEKHGRDCYWGFPNHDEIIRQYADRLQSTSRQEAGLSHLPMSSALVLDLQTLNRDNLIALYRTTILGTSAWLVVGLTGFLLIRRWTSILRNRRIWLVAIGGLLILGSFLAAGLVWSTNARNLEALKLVQAGRVPAKDLGPLLDSKVQTQRAIVAGVAGAAVGTLVILWSELPRLRRRPPEAS